MSLLKILGMPLSHCKKWTSKPPTVGGMWTGVGGLPAGPERTSALPALTNLAQSCCPQFKLIFSCTHWYSHSSCYGWYTSGCSVSLWLVTEAILLGYHVHFDWSWHLFQLVTAIFLIGHNVHSNWSQHPFRLVTLSILIYQDIILLS